MVSARNGKKLHWNMMVFQRMIESERFGDRNDLICRSMENQCRRGNLTGIGNRRAGPIEFRALGSDGVPPSEYRPASMQSLSHHGPAYQPCLTPLRRAWSYRGPLQLNGVGPCGRMYAMVSPDGENAG